MNTQLIIAFAGPILTAFLGALGIYVQEWRERRNARSLRSNIRAEASEYVALLLKWLDAQQRVCSENELLEAKQRIRIELDNLYASFSAEPTVKRTLDAQAAQTFMQRALLLYRPKHALGWFARIVYFGLLLLVLLFSLGMVTSRTLQWSDLPLLLISYGIFAIPLFLVRSWAVAIDRRATAETA